MSESSGIQYGKLFIRVLVAFLVAVSVAALISLVGREGLTPAVVGEIVVTVYVSALVVYGVFLGTLTGRRFRIALYFGVVLWGGERFLSGNDSVLTVALLLGGMGMVIREIYFNE